VARLGGSDAFWQIVLQFQTQGDRIPHKVCETAQWVCSFRLQDDFEGVKAVLKQKADQFN